jgi:CheY-like chemotaxis protein
VSRSWPAQNLVDNLPLIEADPDQVHQAVTHLTSNALHAVVESSERRCVKISTALHGMMVQVKVEDSGPGAPEHLLSRIFEPFFTTRDVGAGTGLGLSIVHSIMSDHHGRVFCQTSCYGGAAFVLEFPLISAGTAGHTHVAPSSELVPAPSLSASGSQQARILVVDDEKSIAEMLTEMLSLLGYEATLCHSAPQALELLEDEAFDLVLSDYRMPMMDGQEFFTLACRRRPELVQRFVFLSGDVVGEEMKEFLQSHRIAHLSKPCRMDHVAKVVARVLQETPHSDPNSSD